MTSAISGRTFRTPVCSQLSQTESDGFDSERWLWLIVSTLVAHRTRLSARFSAACSRCCLRQSSCHLKWLLRLIPTWRIWYPLWLSRVYLLNDPSLTAKAVHIRKRDWWHANFNWFWWAASRLDARGQVDGFTALIFLNSYHQINRYVISYANSLCMSTDTFIIEYASVLIKSQKTLEIYKLLNVTRVFILDDLFQRSLFPKVVGTRIVSRLFLTHLFS